MKKIAVVIFVMISVSFASNAQNSEALIKADFEKIIQFSQKQEIKKVIEMTYPRYVAIYPEGVMAGMAEGLIKGMGLKITYDNSPYNIKLSALTTLKNGTICMGEYDNNSILEFENEMMVKLFTMAPIEGFVVTKLEEKKIRMVGKSYLLAIKDSYTKNEWKYLNYDIEVGDKTKEFLSDEIIKAAESLKAGFKK